MTTREWTKEEIDYVKSRPEFNNDYLASVLKRTKEEVADLKWKEVYNNPNRELFVRARVGLSKNLPERYLPCPHRDKDGNLHGFSYPNETNDSNSSKGWYCNGIREDGYKCMHHYSPKLNKKGRKVGSKRQKRNNENDSRVLQGLCKEL